MKSFFYLKAGILGISLAVLYAGSCVIAAANPAVTANTSREISSVHKAFELYQSKNYSEAAREYSGVIEENGKLAESVEVLLPYAKSLSFNGKFSDAIKYYKAALKIRPDDYDIKFGYAQTCLWSGEYSAAAEIFKAMLDKKPNDTDAAINLSKSYFFSGRRPEAFMLLEAAAANHPENVELKNELATLLTWDGDYKRAIFIYNEILKAVPNDIGAINGIAKIQAWRGNYQKSLEYYNKALKIKHDNIDAEIGAGNILNQLNLSYEAMEKAKLARKKCQSAGENELKAISELENSILEKEKPGINISRSSSEDSDKTCVSANKFSYKAGIGLKTKARINFARYSAKINGTANTGSAECISLSAERYISRYIKTIYILNSYKLDEPQNGSHSKIFPGIGLLWQKFNKCYALFIVDKGFLIDTPALIKNRITNLTKALEFFYSFNPKTNLTVNYSISDFSDTNQKINYIITLEKNILKNSKNILFLGGEIKNFTFKNTAFNGYYSPAKYNSNGFFYRLNHKIKNCTLSVKETFGRQDADGDGKRYVNKEISLTHSFDELTSFNIQYLKSNTAISSIAGYDYKFILFGLSRRW